MIHVEIAVSAPLFTSLTYAYDSELTGLYPEAISELIGRRVLVPLSGRIVTGYILGEAKDLDPRFRVKKIKTVQEGGPFFHKEMIPFFQWIATYYHFPIGEVITTALPAGLRRSSKRIITLTDSSRGGNTTMLDDFLDPGWFSELIAKSSLGAGLSTKVLGDSSQRKLIKKLVELDIIALKTILPKDGVRDKKEVCYVLKEGITLPDPGQQEDFAQANKEYRRILEKNSGDSFKLSEAKLLLHYLRISEKYEGKVPQKEILRAYPAGNRPLSFLCQRGLLQKEWRRVYRTPLGEALSFVERPERLSKEQDAAVTIIQGALTKKCFKPFLLYGVTGSGKTEVYLRAAEQCISEGRDVLLLVPEIALATQLESHFISRFGDLVGLLHSGLTPGEKYDQWSLIVQQKVKVVIGARSAVFAPLVNIGLVIVDEEHDSGFKQDDGLHYNGRDLAVLRAKLEGCVVLLGSATPSVTSYHNTTIGKYGLLTLSQRIGETTLPKVETIDLRQSGDRRKTTVFHHRFLEEIEANLKSGEQSIILMNRRGFSTSYMCQECGAAIQCNHCNVTLTYHKKWKKLLCHYCGYSVTEDLICSTCNSENLIPYGFGTERIEEKLVEYFPQAVIGRIDSDIASDRKRFLQILRRMEGNEIDILIGTQMIAKGHHFPNVTFVGVVWADGGLNMPDFRASERIFQLLSQVTGRAGRGEKKGRVIIQTMRPNHYAIALAKEHRYLEFYENEIGIRNNPRFPPYVRLACVKFSGAYEYEVRSTAMNILRLCQEYQGNSDGDLEILGPAPSPLEKIKDQYRWQLLLKSEKVALLQKISRIIGEKKAKRGVGKVKVVVDIDPENLM